MESAVDHTSAARARHLVARIGITLPFWCPEAAKEKANTLFSERDRRCMSHPFCKADMIICKFDLNDTVSVLVLL